MHFAKPAPPRITKATVRFGSSLSPPVTCLAAALTAALVAEPASRPAGKQQACSTSKSPRHRPGAFYFVPQCCAIGSRNNARRRIQPSPHRRNRTNRAQDGRLLRRNRHRWKIERLFASLQNYRRLVTRYEYYLENFTGMLHLACALILLRHL